jgi:CBS-domain-containing membrane protein
VNPKVRGWFARAIEPAFGRPAPSPRRWTLGTTLIVIFGVASLAAFAVIFFAGPNPPLVVTWVACLGGVTVAAFVRRS